MLNAKEKLEKKRNQMQKSNSSYYPYPYTTTDNISCTTKQSKDDNPFLTGFIIGVIAAAVLLLAFSIRCGFDYNKFFDPLSNNVGIINITQDKASPEDTTLEDVTFSDDRSDYLSFDLLIKLKPEIWDNLSYDEKFNAMDEVIDLELENLGIDSYNRPEFKAEEELSNEGTWGYYCHHDKLIAIDYDHLANDSVDTVLNTIAHETRHCYQHTSIDLYENKDKAYKKLASAEDIKRYIDDFDNYVSISDGAEYYDQYYNQYVEIDAREYAASRVEDYQSMIDYYGL